MFQTALNLSAEKSPCIYCVRLIGTNRVYVGQTIKLLKRLREHIMCSKIRPKSSPKFYNAIRKYGVEAFEVTILARCDIASLDSLEIHFIGQLNTLEIGFNLHDNPFLPLRGRKHTEEHKAKMSALKKGVKRSPETVEKIRKAGIGRRPSDRCIAGFIARIKGKPKSEAQKAKMREAALRRPSPSEDTRAKMRASQGSSKLCAEAALRRGSPIVQKSLIGEPVSRFTSIAEAARQTRVNRTNINRCLVDGRLTAGGFKWQYAPSN